MSRGTIKHETTVAIGQVAQVKISLNSQNLPVLEFILENGDKFQLTCWTNHRLILQSVSGGETINLTTWTGT